MATKKDRSDETPKQPRKAQPASEPATPPEPKGNFLGEWFGFQVWPPVRVDSSKQAFIFQSGRLCPFISAATRQHTACIKAKKEGEEPTGVCTISSDSNGTRENWLACPFRILDQHFTLLGQGIRTVCNLADAEKLSMYPITVLNKNERKAEILKILKDKTERVFLFTANKLGEEVDIPKTTSSPGVKVDFSVIEATLKDSDPTVPLEFGKVMMFEIQTADFHGSPTHAVGFLKGVCPKGQTEPYHDKIKADPEKVGNKVEGPNKANIFKRTIYQMLYKMELARDASCAGFVIVLPQPVWTSWLPHLGRPGLTTDKEDPNLKRLEVPEAADATGDVEIVKAMPAWIIVFDIDANSAESPKPLKIIHRIATDAASLMHFAFEEAVTKATGAGVVATYRTNFIERVKKFWQASQDVNITEAEGFVPDDDTEDE